MIVRMRWKCSGAIQRQPGNVLRRHPGPTCLGPATDCAVMGDLEPTSAIRREVVQRDNSILQLAVEDPDATLSYDPRRWAFTVSRTDIDRDVSVTLASPLGADCGPYTVAHSWG